MLKEIKYFIFFITICLFIFFSIKFYISDENKKKTFRNLSLIDKNIEIYEEVYLVPNPKNMIIEIFPFKKRYVNRILAYI